MNVLYSVGNYYGAHHPFSDLFDAVVVINREDYATAPFDKTDVVLFGGGEDISPSIYKQKPSRYCHSSIRLSARDTFEIEVFNKAVAAGSGLLGICRGAQLLCALSGGSLIQHVTYHAGTDHEMSTSDGKIMTVCSVHHQMMNPFGTKHELIGWATHKLSGVYLIEDEKKVDMEVEPEVVFFPETKALGIQYHPEFMSDKDEAVIYSRELVKKYLLKG